MFIRDQRNVVLLCPCHTSVQHGLQEWTRNLNEILQGIVGKLDIRIAAVGRILDFGFNEIELHRIEAKYIVGNEASRRVMEKCNMKFEGIAKGSMKIKGEYRDIGKCAILKGEYTLSLFSD